MRRYHRSILFSLALMGLVITPAAAQFGQNKINYDRFEWKTYKAPHFDVYYYFESDAMLREVVSEAESAYLDIGKRLDHEISQRIPMILYRTHGDFQRTNIQFRELPEAVGAFAEPFMFRLVLPVDSPPERRYRLIRHEMVHIYQFDILYSGSLQRTVRGQPPLWFMEGMASYIGDDEDSMDQMAIRDAVVNNLMPSIRQLNSYGYLTYRYGHAVFDFIEETWGEEGLRQLIFEVRKALMARNLDKAFRDAFGIDVPTFDRRFSRFLRRRYLPILTSKRAPDEYGPEIGVHKPGVYTFSPALSPSGDLVAALATPSLELDLLILSTKDGKVQRNLTKGFTNRYQYLIAEVFSGKRDLTWSPAGDEIAFFVRKEDHRELLLYNPISGRRIDTVPFKKIAATASPSFSPDGKWIAFSGNLDGQWDIFRYSLETGAIENLTQDPYVDSNPMWSADGKQVIYNRRIGAFAKIFVVQVGSPQRKTQLTAGASSDIEPAFSRDGKYVYFSSDRGLYGVFNLHRLELATAKIERLTDLVGGAFSPVEMAPGADGSVQLTYTAFFGGTFRLFKLDLDDDDVQQARKAGEQEPQTSPLAPSRRSQAKQIQKLEKEGLNFKEAEKKVAEKAAATEGVKEADADLAPFQPPLELSLDQDDKKPYEKKWQMDAPQISVGLTDDSRILANFGLNWTDLLGDHRIFLGAESYDGFNRTTLAYMNLRGRTDWGAVLRDYRDYYLTNDPLGVNRDLQRRTRFTSISGFASYPFNRYYRVEGSLSYSQSRLDYPVGQDQFGFLVFQHFTDDYPAATVDFVGDTTRFQRFGPFQGHRFRIGVTNTKFVSGDRDGQSLTNYHLDFRAYKKVTRRSVLAMRLYGIFQDGDQGNLYTMGGINQLRGFEFREFVGENIAVANFEFRFPLIDALKWGYGGIWGPIRGVFFVNVGSAWFEDEVVRDLFDPSAPAQKTKAVFDRRIGGFRKYHGKVDGRYVDIHATVGYGFMIPIFGLPANWSFSKIYDGKDFGSWRQDFFIVFDW